MPKEINIVGAGCIVPLPRFSGRADLLEAESWELPTMYQIGALIKPYRRGNSLGEGFFIIYCLYKILI